MSSSERQLFLNRRSLYPRGLLQPAGSFRFSVDALLLASLFSSQHMAKGRIVDLGTGCGVVALGTLLQNPDAVAIGIDKQSVLIDAAKANIAALGFADQMHAVCLDLDKLMDSALSWPDAIPLQASASLVLANPPYRILGTGRLPANPSRRDALFGDHRTLDVFCRSAAYCLNAGGIAGFVFAADRLNDLNTNLHSNGLHCISITYVFPRRDTPATLVLVEASKRKASLVEHSLYLYKDEDGDRKYTEEALQFCPFLKCNAG